MKVTNVKPGWLLVTEVTTAGNPCAVYGWRVLAGESARTAMGSIVVINYAMPCTYVDTRTRLVQTDWVLATLDEPDDVVLT